MTRPTNPPTPTRARASRRAYVGRHRSDVLHVGGDHPSVWADALMGLAASVALSLLSQTDGSLQPPGLEPLGAPLNLELSLGVLADWAEGASRFLDLVTDNLRWSGLSPCIRAVSPVSLLTRNMVSEIEDMTVELVVASVICAFPPLV